MNETSDDELLKHETTEEDDLLNKQITGIRSTCKTIRSIILRRHGEQLVMPHATTFQAQLFSQTHKAWHYIDDIQNKLLKYLT